MQAKASSSRRLMRMVTVPISFRHLIWGQAKYFTQQGFEVMQVSADGPELPEVLAHEKVPHTQIPFTRQITPWQDLKCLWKLIILILQWKPDIVHTQTPKAGLLGLLAARLCGVPLRVHTVGGMPLMETTGLKRRLLESIEKLTYACAHVVLPNSRQLASWMVETGLAPAGKLKVLGEGSSNGINTRYFDPIAVAESKEFLREKLAIPLGAKVFVFVGRLVRDKGLVELSKAFNHLLTKHPDAWLLLVGPWEQHLDPLPQETVLYISDHPRITLTGYQSDIRPYLKAADFLAFPSYREGFPNVVMQAGAMGLPVIATNINGCNEIIVPGKNGMLIPPKDADALLHAMEQVLNQPEETNALADNAREMIVSRYDQQRLWDQIGEVYRQGK